MPLRKLQLRSHGYGTPVLRGRQNGVSLWERGKLGKPGGGDYQLNARTWWRYKPDLHCPVEAWELCDGGRTHRAWEGSLSQVSNCGPEGSEGADKERLVCSRVGDQPSLATGFLRQKLGYNAPRQTPQIHHPSTVADLVEGKLSLTPSRSIKSKR